MVEAPEGSRRSPHEYYRGDKNYTFKEPRSSRKWWDRTFRSGRHHIPKIVCQEKRGKKLNSKEQAKSLVYKWYFSLSHPKTDKCTCLSYMNCTWLPLKKPNLAKLHNIYMKGRWNDIECISGWNDVMAVGWQQVKELLRRYHSSRLEPNQGTP